MATVLRHVQLPSRLRLAPQILGTSDPTFRDRPLSFTPLPPQKIFVLTTRLLRGMSSSCMHQTQYACVYTKALHTCGPAGSL